MSCDRESVTSCQDLLAMSRTVQLYWVHQRLALCQLVAGPDESRIRGNRLRRRPSRAGGCIVAREWAGRNCGD